MTQIVRSLLVLGNDKLSRGVYHFDLPARKTCPGKSRRCSRRCYATRGRYGFPRVQERLAWNYAQSKRSDFVDRMVDTLYRRGVLLMRWHCSGDVYSPAYGRKVLEIIGRSPHCRFWLYSRSWRVKAIFPILKAISDLPNANVWFSADQETGYPEEVAEYCRIAWMQTEVDEDTTDADLVFLDHPLRKLALELPTVGTVCPAELPDGKERGTTCATCGKCWK